MKLKTLFIAFIAALLAACVPLGNSATTDAEVVAPGMGMGPGGMMGRHHADVPEDFANLTNPISADDESLARGEEIYATHCATCHGDGGMGDGPGGASLDPLPAPIAHTSQMMSDAYIFWRVTEGGIPFNTAMIPYRDILDEQARWDVINYVRALGSGQVVPRPNMGGMSFDPEAETAHRAEMLAEAIELGVISQEEADIFETVHKEIDSYTLAEGISGMQTGNRGDVIPQILDALVESEALTQEQTDVFVEIHDRLVEKGLMQ